MTSELKENGTVKKPWPTCQKDMSISKATSYTGPIVWAFTVLIGPSRTSTPSRRSGRETASASTYYVMSVDSAALFKFAAYHSVDRKKFTSKFFHYPSRSFYVYLFLHWDSKLIAGGLLGQSHCTPVNRDGSKGSTNYVRNSGPGFELSLHIIRAGEFTLPMVDAGWQLWRDLYMDIAALRHNFQMK